MRYVSWTSKVRDAFRVSRLTQVLTLTLLSLFLMMSSDAFAATYYVSPGGNNVNAGTSTAAPWASFSKAMTVLKPGDTLYLMDGTYYQSLTVTVSGNSTSPISIKALNDGKAIVDMNKGGNPLYIRTSYIEVEGIIFRDGLNSVVQLLDADHITLRRISAYNPGSHQMGILGVKLTNSVIEDSVVSGEPGVMYIGMEFTGGGGNNIFRRCFVYASDPGMVAYQDDNNTMENNVIFAQNSSYSYGTKWGMTGNNTYGAGASYNSYLGNIVLGNPTGVTFYGSYGLTNRVCDGGASQITGNVFSNNVGINDQFYGMKIENDTNLLVTNNTLVQTRTDLPAGNNYGFFTAWPWDGGSTIKANVTNNSFLGNGKANLYAFSVNGWAGGCNLTRTPSVTVNHSYNNFYNFATKYSGTTQGAGEQFVNPSYDTATYGNGAYLMPPASLEGRGQGGADIGATVLYAYEDGVLTNQRLWPWPMEDRIAAELGISVTYMNDGKGHTGGIWKTLNGVYDGTTPPPPPPPASDGSDTTPPSMPAGLITTVPSSSQINLAWTASSDPIVSGQTTSGLAGYNVFSGGSKLASVTGTSYSHTGLLPAKSYSYAVSAFDAAGNTGPLSNVITATTQGTQPLQYTITASAGTGGSIAPSGATSVNSGSGQSFTITPNTGYKIATVTVDGIPAAAESPYTFSNVTTNHIITATFAPVATTGTTYLSDLPWVDTPVNGWGPVEKNMSNGEAAAGDGRTITLNGVTYQKGIGAHADSVVTYNLGGKYSRFVSDIGVDDETGTSGSIIFQVLADGVKLFDSGIMTASSAVQTVDVDVTGKNELKLVINSGDSIDGGHGDWADARLIAASSYTITATAGSGGGISPSGATSVNSGGSQSYTITPQVGFKIADVKVDGTSAGAVSTYTFSSVSSSHTIAATFAADTYTLTATAGVGGSISPAGTTTVNGGGSQSYTITPSAGYKIAGVTVDGASAGAVSAYTFSNVTANHTIAATFAIDSYTITATAGPGGSISPSGAVSVNSGSNRAFTITPDAGYRIAGVTVDGVSAGAVSMYAFSNVTANHTIAATFTVEVYTINATAGADGKISPAGMVPVNSGSSQSFTFTPNAGFKVEEVKVDGVSAGAVNTYTFSNVTAAHTISCTFAAIPTVPTTTVVFANNAGGGNFTSASGVVYQADSKFAGGSKSSTSAAIAGTSDDKLYQSDRYGNFSYNIPLANGTYTVTLKFAEHYWTSAGRRVFNVSMQGTQVISKLDIFAKVGKNAAYDVSVPVSVTNGMLNIKFTTIADNAKVNAILVTGLKGAATTHTVSATAGAGGTISPLGTTTVNSGTSQSFTITPNAGYKIENVKVDGTSVGAVATYTFSNVTEDHTLAATFAAVTAPAPAVAFAVNSGGSNYTSPSGVVYQTDAKYFGGSKSSNTAPIAGTSDDTLYQSDRYGNFTYDVPLANGNYTVTLKFAETYWNASGWRIFNVYMQGLQVITNLDIFAKVGKNAAYDVSVPVSVTNGMLNIRFSGVTDNAKVNAIVVTKK